MPATVHDHQPTAITCSRCDEPACCCECCTFLECNACGFEFDATGAEIYADAVACPDCGLTIDGAA